MTSSRNYYETVCIRRILKLEKWPVLLIGCVFLWQHIAFGLKGPDFFNNLAVNIRWKSHPTILQFYIHWNIFFQIIRYPWNTCRICYNLKRIRNWILLVHIACSLQDRTLFVTSMWIIWLKYLLCSTLSKWSMYCSNSCNSQAARWAYPDLADTVFFSHLIRHTKKIWLVNGVHLWAFSKSHFHPYHNWWVTPKYYMIIIYID